MEAIIEKNVGSWGDKTRNKEDKLKEYLSDEFLSADSTFLQGRFSFSIRGFKEGTKMSVKKKKTKMAMTIAMKNKKNFLKLDEATHKSPIFQIQSHEGSLNSSKFPSKQNLLNKKLFSEQRLGYKKDCCIERQSTYLSTREDTETKESCREEYLVNSGRATNNSLRKSRKFTKSTKKNKKVSHEYSAKGSKRLILTMKQKKPSNKEFFARKLSVEANPKILNFSKIRQDTLDPDPSPIDYCANIEEAVSNGSIDFDTVSHHPRGSIQEKASHSKFSDTLEVAVPLKFKSDSFKIEPKDTDQESGQIAKEKSLSKTEFTKNSSNTADDEYSLFDW